MRAIVLALFSLFAFAAPLAASNIVIMVVEDPNNYEAPRTMRDFAEKQLGHHVTIIDGDKPQMHHFEGLVEALKDADLLVRFSRRRFPPKDQMAAIRAHLAADVTPLLIGTAKTETSPPMPIAWTRSYGAKKARIFYISLGAPEDMQIADVRRLLVNAVKWTLNPEAR